MLIVAQNIILFVVPSSSDILNVIVLESVSLLPIKTDKKTRLGNQDSMCKNLMIVLPVFWFFFIIVLILIVWWAGTSLDLESKATSEEYGEQMEIDIRLPYKGFREIYPYSKIANQEYKQLQMKNAFKR